MKRIVSVATLCLMGCVPQSPTPPTPAALEIQSSMPVSSALGIAGRVLSDAGFDIVTSDANAGLLAAKRTREKIGNSSYLHCKNGMGEEGKQQNLAAEALTTTVTVNITAQPTATGSSIRPAARVMAIYGDTGVGRLPDSDTDCVSSGVIEQRIADALRSAR